MKTNKLKIVKIIAPILVLGAIISCEPEEIDAKNTKNIVSASINTVGFVSASTNAKLYLTTTSTDTNLQIVTTGKNQDILEINVNSLVEKSYSHGAEENPDISFKYKKFTNGVTVPYESNAGSLTLQKHDKDKKTISGTFNFTASSNKIESGVFTEVNY